MLSGGVSPGVPGSPGGRKSGKILGSRKQFFFLFFAGNLQKPLLCGLFSAV
jgi:hypothetical protein